VLVGALVLCMGLAAMDSTIVSTALPTIVGELGGFASFSWVISLYLLAQTATIPVYGRLADLYGRRPVLLAGIGLFLVGSVLSGAARGMRQLILFRGLQGLGAGAILPIAVTIIGDIYTLEQRARMQGVFSSVWAVSAIVGPTLGGWLTQSFTWRLIFYINLPLGALAVAGLLLGYRERVAHHGHRVDYPGAVLLLMGVSGLLLWILGGGVDWPWASGTSLALALGAAVLLAAFAAVEARAPEPVLPFAVLAQRVIAVGDAGGLLAGGVAVGLSSYLPTYVQGVLGRAPTTAGLVVAAMSIGWPLASALCGRVILRTSYRFAAVFGGVLAVGGSVLLWLLTPRSPLAHPAAGAFLVGSGMGFISTTALVAIQGAVPWRQRGVATSSNTFARQLGSTVFVAIFGAVLNAGLLARLGPGSAGRSALAQVGALLAPAARGALPPATLASLTSALAGALHAVYGWSTALALVVLGVLCAMPGGKPTEAGRAQDLAGE
jgi:EmrB/QacA subfamily drug resistance transporter